MTITAAEMAEDAGIDYDRFRETLSQAGFDWHESGERWEAAAGSRAHRDMQRVLDRLLDQDGRFEAAETPGTPGTSPGAGSEAGSGPWDGFAASAMGGATLRHPDDPMRAAQLAGRHADALMSERRSRRGD